MNESKAIPTAAIIVGPGCRQAGSPSVSVAPRATAMHYAVLDDFGHCTVVDSKPSVSALASRSLAIRVATPHWKPPGKNIQPKYYLADECHWFYSK